MPTEIVIPPVGESVTEGVIAKWLKGEGEAVKRDEPVLELETDKITVEVPAPASGVVKQSAKVGQTVQVGTVVGAVDESAAPVAAAGPKADQAPVKQGGKPAPAPSAAPAPGPSNGAAASAPDHDDVRVTPLARKLIEERGLDVSKIKGTGPGGRVREQDVTAFLQGGQAQAQVQAQAPAAAAAHAAARPAAQQPAAGVERRVTRERMTPLRQRIAARLVEAQHTAAMLTTFNECDMSAVMAIRAKHKESFEKQHGIGLGFMSFFVKACVNALGAFQRVNAQIADGAEGPEIVQHHYCDIAVAVSTPKGLVVPVLRGCERLSFAEVEQGIKDLAVRARDGKLALEDMQGGTFTITNGGIYGSMMSTPILNPPQSGILGMHNIVRRPVENPDKPGSGEVVVRPMMYLALSYDHRMVDGAEAVGFLKRVKECIEDPTRILVGM